MKADVQAYVRACHLCHQVRPPDHGTPCPMDQRPVLSRGDVFCVDLIGPLPVSGNKSEYALVLMDEHERNVEVSPLRSASSRTICARLIDFCVRFGMPLCIQSNNGPKFARGLWTAVCRALGTNPKKVEPCLPQGGTCAHGRKVVERMIQMYAAEHSDWDLQLDTLVFSCRFLANHTTDHPSPANLAH